jgi:hypothetical protein
MSFLFYLEREKKSLVMGTFGGTDYGDDSGSILNDCKKAYRRSLANNTITEFDFRQYLFAIEYPFNNFHFFLFFQASLYITKT